MNDQIHPEEHTEQEQPDLSPERPHPRRQRSWSGTLTLAFSFLAMLLAGMALLLAVLDRPAKEPEEEPAGPATFQFGEQTLEVLEGTDLVSSTVISGNGDLASLCSALVYTPTTVLVDGEGTLMEVIVGGQADLSGTYLAAVNKVLAASGKAEISLAE